MYQGNWKCSKCGGTITQLPFEPRSEAGLTCRDCYFKEKNGDSAESADTAPATNGELDDRDVPDFDPMEGSTASEPQGDDGLDATPATPGEKPKFAGDWKCSGCGGTISSLPFQPRNTENLKCLDCFKKSKS